MSFGLVNVPVKAYTAVRDHKVHFHQIDSRSGARIRNKKVSGESGKPVDDDDIEMGYEVSKGHYVTFTPDEIDELRPRSTRSIDVSDFVDLAEIDPIYYQRTYWLAPDGEPAERAYRLLRTAMEDKERVGIGSVVMRNKQYDPKEMRLAEQIIDALTSPWDPTRYHDTYTEEVRDLIERKRKGEQLVIEEEVESPAKVVDLMAALEESVKSARSSKPSRSRRSKSSSSSAESRSSRKAPAKKSA